MPDETCRAFFVHNKTYKILLTSREFRDIIKLQVYKFRK